MRDLNEYYKFIFHYYKTMYSYMPQCHLYSIRLCVDRFASLYSSAVLSEPDTKKICKLITSIYKQRIFLKLTTHTVFISVP